ncbi:hypothetical protein [Thermotalea metallivorans]|uniref:Type IV pilus assembly protein PilO n=1 Tax=Thermotalea metallivorans TaxID=520762 RepID=A0A140L8A6_9FIRM|nr:hypothetical protein [Thermotalea metallivorans]KXG76781.1 hypothetical protein AN619_07730 [Thermotalea metallivorans]
MKLILNKKSGTSSLKGSIVQIVEKFRSSLTKREKILLGILAVSIFFLGYYYLILKPDLEKISFLQEKAEKYKQQYNQIMMDTSSDNPIHKEFKILKAKILMAAERLFPEMKQEKIIVVLDHMIKESNIRVSSISFTEPAIDTVETVKENQTNPPYILYDLAKQYRGEIDPVPPSQEKPGGENGPDQSQNKGNSVQAEKMEATLQFEGSYSNLMKFIKALENYEKNIIIKNLSVIGKNDDHTLKGNITIVFYAIPKLFHEDDAFLNWNFDNFYGKENPFDPFGGYEVHAATKSDKSENATAVAVDFFLAVNAITSDIPTVVMGKSDDNRAETYVYADNADFEDVELQIYKVDHTYYYKYKTQRESYPKDYENNGVEFQPKGSKIYFKIYSNKRNSDNDKNGVYLKLINKTDMELIVDIDEDDIERPRVSVKEKLGHVLIKK